MGGIKDIEKAKPDVMIILIFIVYTNLLHVSNEQTEYAII